MVAYSFNRRFVSHVAVGLEPGPWLPGMKRHTLRLPRAGRSRHARPEQPVQLYSGMRTRHCRLIGRAVCRMTMPVQLLWDGHDLSIRRGDGGAPRSYVMQLAPIVRRILDAPVGTAFVGDDMDEFARTDGFADRAEMAGFFDTPLEAPDDWEDCDGAWMLPLVLIAWAPGEPFGVGGPV